MKRSNHLMRRWVLLLLCVFLCMMTAAPVTAASKKGTVTSVSVTNVSKGSLSLDKGKTFTLKVAVKGSGTFSKAVKYKSSNAKVVSVTDKGVITGLQKGTATITVTSSANAKKTATVEVTVKIPVTKVTLNKTTATVAKGKTLQLTANVLPAAASNKAVTWASSNTKVASVSTSGKVTAKAAGKATITATAKDGSKKSGSCVVTVTIPVTSVSVNKTAIVLDKNGTAQLTANVLPTTASNKAVTWASSNTKVATVSTSGKVTAKAAGKATITATAKDGSKKSGSCAVTVTIPVTSVSLNKTAIVLDKNETAQLTANVLPANATNKKVTYSSSNSKIVSVTENGKIKGLKNGKATITVTTVNGKKTAACTVNVKTSVKSVALTVPETMQAGTEGKATAAVTPADASGVKYAYEGDNAEVAEVDADGTIRAIANGDVNVKVTAEDSRGNKVTDTAKISVFTPVESVSFAEGSILLNKGEEKALEISILPETASNKKVSFSSSDPEAASVDENGLVKALATGKTTVTVTTEDGEKTADCEIEVRNPVTAVSLTVPDRIAAGTEAQASAAWTPEDADGASVIFQGDNRDVAEVSEDGTVRAIANGIVKVMATVTDRYGNTAYDEKDVTVWTPVSEVRLSDEALVLYEEEEKQLIVTVLPEEASQKKVSFTSSDENIVKVNDNGLIKAIAEGNAVVKALSEDGEHGASCAIEVKKVQTSATVSSQAELETALQNEMLQQLSIVSDSEVSFTVPEGNYSQVSLTVNVPNGHVENRGLFKNIVIIGTGKAAFVEYAEGNNIIYKAEGGRVMTEPGAVLTSLTVEEGGSSIDIVNNGDIANIIIAVPSDVRISGENESRLNVAAARSAENAVVHTSITLKVEAEAPITLDLQAGSENTMVNVDTQENAPALTGIGEVPVMTRDNGVTEVILADNIEADSTQNIRISGTVRSTGQTPIAGANLYFIPYSSHIDEETIASRTGDALTAAVTEEDGSFLSEEIPIGNYYAYVAAEGCQPVCRKLAANSTYGGVYPFGDIVMLAEGETETGSIAGTLTNARTNEPVGEGITVRLRSGADNKSGSFMAETLTDASGSYAFQDLPAGQYTVQVLDLRNEENGYYLTDYASLAVGGGMTADGDFAIRFSASEAGNQVTFTLTWGSEGSGASSDLDSHLTGPTPDGGQFHTWYGNGEYYYYDGEGGDQRYDFLDYDDTSWEGPENTTIEKSVNGIYHFYVHDFSNGGNPASTQMSRSSAVVTVHSSEGTLGIYNMPNETGNLWHVCDYDSRTGKITAVNKVYGYTGSTSEIGEDLVEKYRGLLREYLEKAEPLKTMADEDALAMLSDAEKTLAQSEDAYELMQAYEEVREFVNSAVYGLQIDHISGDTVKSYLYDFEEIVTGDVALTIRGYDPELSTEKIQIYLYDDSSSWEWKPDSGDASGYMIVVTNTKGLSCRYHVSYEADTTDCSISSVNAVRDEQNLVDNWYTDYSYIEDGDAERKIDTLIVYGCDVSLPSEFAVTPRNPYASAGAVTSSDISGYDGKVTVSAGETAKTYYIQWKASSSILNVGSVTAKNNDGNSLLTDWYWDYDWRYDDETGEEYQLYYINVDSYSADALRFLNVEPRFSSVEAGEIVESDRSGYAGMVTFRCGDLSRTWYIRLNIYDYVFDIYDIDAYDAEDNYVSLEWSAEKEYDGEGNAVRSYLDLKGSSETMPANIEFYPSYDATVSEMEASDVEGYDGKITVTYNGVQKTWYIRYGLGEQVCEIGSITATDAQGDSLIDYYEKNYSWVWDDELQKDVKIHYAYIYGYSPTVPENLEVTARYDGVTIGEIVDSDRDGYDKMVTLSRGSQSRTYYIRWDLSSNVFKPGNVSANDSGGNSLLTDWYWDYYWDYDNETGEEYQINYIDVYSSSSDVLQYLKVVPAFSTVEAGEILDSDRSGFDKMVIFSASGQTRTWYIRLFIEENPYDEAGDDMDSSGEAAVLEDPVVPDEENAETAQEEAEEAAQPDALDEAEDAAQPDAQEEVEEPSQPDALDEAEEAAQPDVQDDVKADSQNDEEAGAEVDVRNDTDADSEAGDQADTEDGAQTDETAAPPEEQTNFEGGEDAADEAGAADKSGEADEMDPADEATVAEEVVFEDEAVLDDTTDETVDSDEEAADETGLEETDEDAAVLELTESVNETDSVVEADLYGMDAEAVETE